MASTRKSNLTDTIATQLAPLLPKQSFLLVGLSGGMDSVVLLHILHSLAPRFEWKLTSLHVHHGISVNADSWADFCTDLCSQYDIPLIIERVNLGHLRSDYGVEAAARKLRLASFSKNHCDFVALAHHADDQVETLLLQLLRGTGIKGAAAMPILKSATTNSHPTIRPLLNIPRSLLLEYALQNSLKWVNDESNADDSYPRNFLRNQLLPLMEDKFPAYRDTLTRGAQHFAEANELLDDLAQQDSQGWTVNQGLDVTQLRTLTTIRAKNLLRHFIHKQGAPMPQSAQLEEILQQLLVAREDATICVDFGGWQVRRYQDIAYVFPDFGSIETGIIVPWQGEEELYWPALRRAITFRRMHGQGISIAMLQRAPVTLRLRSGGESLRPINNSSTRSLKNLLQEHHIPPWQRERLPLLYNGDELVCIVGVAISAEYQARQHEVGVLVS